MFNPVSSIRSLITPKTQYKLLKKTKKLPVEEFNGGWTVPENAKYFSVVKVGKRNDKEFQREIVSFYDEKEPIRKCFSGAGMNNKIRDYVYNFQLPQKGVEMNGAYGVNVRKIKTTEYNPEQFTYELKQDEEQFLYHMFDKQTNSYTYAKKLHINKNKYTREKDGLNVDASITEYPMTLGFEPKESKKVLSAKLKMDGNNAVLQEISEQKNIDVDTNDEFLPYRFLVGSRKQECLAQHFLNKNGLGNAGIKIYTNKDSVSPNSAAYFSSQNREIVFKEVPKYAHPVSIAAHEAEHAYQYSQIGRAGLGTTLYERQCRIYLGPLKKLNEIKEARKYANASDNYPVLSQTENLSQNKDYQQNYLEIKAKEAGKNAEEIYKKGLNFLKQQFKYAGGYSSF